MSSHQSRPPLPSGFRAFIFMVFSFLGLFLHIIFIDFPTDLWRWLTQRRKNIRGQVVVITGAGSGLGRRIAEILAIEQGANVVALDINKSSLLETTQLIAKQMGSVKHYVVDICNEEAMNRVGKEIKAEFGSAYFLLAFLFPGKVDIVISNAGILSFGYFMEESIASIRKTFDVNVIGTINTIRAFLGAMETTNKGHIVTVASMAGFVGETFGISYCTSKFAVRCVMEVLEMELRDMGLEGIKLTTLCPSFTSTPLADHLEPQSLWIPTMDADFCATQMVDAILKEKTLACFPKQCSLLPIGKALGSRNILKSTRKLIDINYEPTIPSETRNRLPPGQDFYLLPNLPLTFAIILLISINLIALFIPDFFYYIPEVGEALAEFCKEYNFIFVVTFFVIILIHLIEAIFALKICDAHRVSFACSFEWFVQTFFFGLSSLLKLMRYSGPVSLEFVDITK